ncbi:MAG TPA: FAD-dependent oxidoreductase [Candidatus Xenobia bacterium]|nr:FAD-dependent oxidoreductase [Candidatus Xenobia bacterium]
MSTEPKSPPRQGDKTRYQARLARVRALTETTKHFEFEVLGPKPFEFTAGQFISLYLPRNGAEDNRAYSLASAPNPTRFNLCLNRVPGGFFSNYLCDLAPGATISFEGPFGFFVAHPSPHDSVFVATGTGIAPIRGILEDLFARGCSRQVWLIFGVRYAETILYREEFEALAARQPNFHFWPTLSRPSADWTGRRGHVQEHVERLVVERPDLQVYLCGLKAMVDDLRQRLRARGLDRKQIRYEKYD